MKILGIISEYNPFHNGHKYQIERAKELCGADAVVAVMSGNYVQRGDISVFEKKVRAKSALLNGVDLVIELPSSMALSSAERFAFCGISLLNAIGTDFVSFGIEDDSLSVLKKAAQLLCDEPSEYKKLLAENLGKGFSFAVSRHNALSSLITNSSASLSSPNNILALEYLKAIIKTNSPITPIPVKRCDNGFHSEAPNGSFISASALRNMIFNRQPIDAFIPSNVLNLYQSSRIHSIVSMEKSVCASLCRLSADEIRQIPDVSEGLENKILKSAFESSGFEELCDKIKSKRYARSRIRRILLCSFLGITKSDLQNPSYIKILDFNRQGQMLLNKIKQETSLPLVKNFNQIRKTGNSNIELLWKKELIFDKIYDLF